MSEYVYVRSSDLPKDPTAPDWSSINSSSSSGANTAASSSFAGGILSSLASIPITILSTITPRCIQNNKGAFFFGTLAVGGAALLVYAITDTTNDILNLEGEGWEDEEKSRGSAQSLSGKKLPSIKPTKQWQEVPEGFAVPPGLEIRMDFESGKRFARLNQQK